eukprot:scaffold338696_cov38-Prasinocladus_malaysianus.AAC.1
MSVWVDPAASCPGGASGSCFERSSCSANWSPGRKQTHLKKRNPGSALVQPVILVASGAARKAPATIRLTHLSRQQITARCSLSATP